MARAAQIFQQLRIDDVDLPKIRLLTEPPDVMPSTPQFSIRRIASFGALLKVCLSLLWTAAKTTG
jgi:hypothetical protein